MRLLEVRLAGRVAADGTQPGDDDRDLRFGIASELQEVGGHALRRDERKRAIGALGDAQAFAPEHPENVAAAHGRAPIVTSVQRSAGTAGIALSCWYARSTSVCVGASLCEAVSLRYLCGRKPPGGIVARRRGPRLRVAARSSSKSASCGFGRIVSASRWSSSPHSAQVQTVVLITSASG